MERLPSNVYEFNLPKHLHIYLELFSLVLFKEYITLYFLYYKHTFYVLLYKFHLASSVGKTLYGITASNCRFALLFFPKIRVIAKIYLVAYMCGNLCSIFLSAV